MIKVLIFFLFLSFSVFADSNLPEVHTLDNGLTVIIEQVPSSQSAAIYALVKVGSVDETECMGCGLSHYVEHMLFKGTALRKVGDIPKEVKALGGVINAQTGFDDTVYTLDVPAINWKQGMDIIADMLQHATVDDKEAESERTVIHGEMRLYEDRPERKLSELVFKAAYLKHPYRHPVIGYKDLFDSVDRKILFDFYKKYYVPNNIVLSVAGNVNSQEVLNYAKELYKNFKMKPVPLRDIQPEGQVVVKRQVIYPYPTKVFRSSYSFHSVSLLDHDLYALDLLAIILGQGESSLLYQELYKKNHVVESVSASNFTPAGQGIFEIEMLHKTNTVEQSIDLINDVLDKVRKTGVDKNQLERTKKQMLVHYYLSSQRASQMAYTNAQDLVYTGNVKFSRYYVDGIKKVTNDDIKRVAQRFLNKDNAVLVILAPQESILKEKESQSVLSQQDQEGRLDNGLNYYLKPDNKVNVFNIALMWRGSLREETPVNNGISHLFIHNWQYSSKHYPQMALTRNLDALGIKLSLSYTKNALTMNLTGAAEDATEALNAVRELLRDVQFNNSTLKEKKEDVLVTLKQRSDNINEVVFLEVFKRFFGKHPYGLDSLGTPENINKLTINDLKNYFKTYIQPSNTYIAVAGNFDANKVKQQLIKQLGDWENNQVVLAKTALDKPQAGVYSLELDKAQAMMVWAFKAPTIYGEDKYTMDVIDNLLGSGLGGRLFTKIRDQFGQAYTLGADFYPGVDTGVFTIHVLTTFDKTEAVKKLVEDEIRMLNVEQVSQEELDTIKKSLKGRRQMSLDTPGALIGTILPDIVYGLGVNNFKKYDEGVDKVTREDVKRAFNQYMDISQAVLVITKPKKSIEQ